MEPSLINIPAELSKLITSQGRRRKRRLFLTLPLPWGVYSSRGGYSALGGYSVIYGNWPACDEHQIRLA